MDFFRKARGFSLAKVLGVSASCAIAWTPNSVRAIEWQVTDAPLRYRVELNKKPSHATAGYVVSLPDGGLLRGKKPATAVLTDDGKSLPSYVLWQNSENGFALVFAKPEEETKAVSVYVQPGGVVRVWNPRTGLTPSPILCVAGGNDKFESAQALAKFGVVEGGAHWFENPGHPKAPFSISGDLAGRAKPGALYQISYVEASVAGEYWVAPFFHTGQGELRVDGAKVGTWEKSKKWGGVGAALRLSKGLHRVEVLQTAPGSGQYVGNLMYLTWRAPKEELKVDDARVVRSSEIAKSGSCKLVSVESRDGTALAAARVTPGLPFWFEDEQPLVIMEFSALSTGGAEDTKVSWTFPEGGTLEGQRVRWLVPGFRDGSVKMTVKSAKSVSTATIPYFGFSTITASLNQAEHRKAFRDTLAEMLSSFPKGSDPLASWGDAWWNNIFRTIEAGKGQRLLASLFGDHFESVKKRLNPTQSRILEDVFLDVSVRDQPEENLKWLQKFFNATTDPVRQSELRFREAELCMYYLNDRKKSENLFTVLASTKGETAERAKIRLGDLALLGSDLNKATSYYADVQNRARIARSTSAQPVGAPVSKRLLDGGSSASMVGGPGFMAPLKGGALQEVSLTENVRTLTESGFLLEALQALNALETEFPLSKISGDFILREADIYMRMRDWRRARPMLEAYCREVDASSYLPDAVSALILCVKSSSADPSGVREIVEKVRDRLKFHPVAAELETFLSGGGDLRK